MRYIVFACFNNNDDDDDDDNNGNNNNTNTKNELSPLLSPSVFLRRLQLYLRKIQMDIGSLEYFAEEAYNAAVISASKEDSHAAKMHLFSKHLYLKQRDGLLDKKLVVQELIGLIETAISNVELVEKISASNITMDTLVRKVQGEEDIGKLLMKLEDLKTPQGKKESTNNVKIDDEIAIDVEYEDIIKKLPSVPSTTTKISSTTKIEKIKITSN